MVDDESLVSAVWPKLRQSATPHCQNFLSHLLVLFRGAACARIGPRIRQTSFVHATPSLETKHCVRPILAILEYHSCPGRWWDSPTLTFGMHIACRNSARFVIRPAWTASLYVSIYVSRSFQTPANAFFHSALYGVSSSHRGSQSRCASVYCQLLRVPPFPSRLIRHHSFFCSSFNRVPFGLELGTA